jgi:transposase-like protein
VYLWADGGYFTVRVEGAKQCLLVIIGTGEYGRKKKVGGQPEQLPEK